MHSQQFQPFTFFDGDVICFVVAFFARTQLYLFFCFGIRNRKIFIGEKLEQIWAESEQEFTASLAKSMYGRPFLPQRNRAFHVKTLQHLAIYTHTETETESNRVSESRVRMPHSMCNVQHIRFTNFNLWHHTNITFYGRIRGLQFFFWLSLSIATSLFQLRLPVLF